MRCTLIRCLWRVEFVNCLFCKKKQLGNNDSEIVQLVILTIFIFDLFFSFFSFKEICWVLPSASCWGHFSQSYFPLCAFAFVAVGAVITAEGRCTKSRETTIDVNVFVLPSHQSLLQQLQRKCCNSAGIVTIGGFKVEPLWLEG